MWLATICVAALPGGSAAQDPVGTCCQYDVSGELYACPSTTESNCSAPTDSTFSWMCPNPSEPDCDASPCDPESIFTGDCPLIDPALPVELTYLEAISSGPQNILLRWETAAEIDNSGFQIEVGATDEDRGFERLAFVEGHGTTSEPHSYSYVASGLDPGTHVFRLKQIDFDGTFEYSPLVEATLEVPGGFVLEEAYPNPFNPTTTIRFGVASRQWVRLTLHDAAGKLARTLFDGTAPANSMQSVTIDGSGLASGTYRVRLEGANVVATRAVTLAK